MCDSMAGVCCVCVCVVIPSPCPPDDNYWGVRGGVIALRLPLVLYHLCVWGHCSETGLSHMTRFTFLFLTAAVFIFTFIIYVYYVTNMYVNQWVDRNHYSIIPNHKTQNITKIIPSHLISFIHSFCLNNNNTHHIIFACHHTHTHFYVIITACDPMKITTSSWNLGV